MCGDLPALAVAKHETPVGEQGVGLVLAPVVG